MATATVDASASNHHLNHLHAESLPLIDLRLLSQSELLSLSFCSSLRYSQNDGDVATPKIDRSVFNESAGSRKQTFSRLRLAPRNNSQFSSSPSIKSPIIPQTAEQGLDEENSQIISLLKSLFGGNSHSDEKEDSKNNYDNNLVSVPIQYNQFLGFPPTGSESLENVPISAANYGGETVMKQEFPTTIVDCTTKKRKRGRPRKNETSFYSNNNNIDKVIETERRQNERETIGVDGSKEKEGEMLMMNKNGMKMDLVTLGSTEDPYGEELAQRTVGMYTEAELVGFLQGLKGEWLTNRKKKMIVEASVLGNVLPSGWKLMLCIKKKASFFWIACRRYIRFLTCFQISSLL